MSKSRELGQLAEIVTVNTAANSVSFGSVTINTVAIAVSGQQINGTSFSGVANNTLYVGTVTAANVVSNAQLQANLGNYQTSAGLSGNVATLTANNTSYVGSVSAANVVSNAQLSANLANYLPLAGGTISGNLIVTGTTVTINAATLDVKDLNITVAKGAGSAAAANGAGITVDSGYANLYYSSSANAWTTTVGLNVVGGNLGIGNTTPQSKLVVEGTGHFRGITLSNTAGLDVGFNTNYSFITSGNRGANTTNRLDFEGSSFKWLTGFGSGQIAQLDSTGFGVGTAPSYPIHVYGSGSPTIYCYNAATSGTYNYAAVQAVSSGATNIAMTAWGNGSARANTGWIQTVSNHPLVLGCNDNGVAWCNPNGAIGIGTSSPYTTLEVNKSGEAGCIVHWPNNARGGLWALSTQRVAFSTTNTADDLVFGYLDATVANSFVEQARLDTSTSKMRIGTSTTLPSETLELYKSGGGVSIRWHSPGVVEYKGGIAAGETLFRFGNANGDAGQSSINHLTMTNAGRVGIHTTSQGNYNLFVQTDYSNFAAMKISGSGGQSWGIGLVVETTGGSDGASIVWRSRGTKNWQIRGETWGTNFQVCEDGGDGSDGSNFGTPRVTFKVGGNVGIGTTDPQYLLDVAGTINSSSITQSSFPAGHVLQVVSTTKTSTFTNGSSQTWADITGMSATITPTSSSSKILVIFNGQCSFNTGGSNYGSATKLLRGTTDIYVGDARGSGTRCAAMTLVNSGSYSSTHSWSYLDSPATTSATTYKVQLWGEAAGAIIGGSYNTGSVWNSNTPITLTLMEIRA